MKEKLFPGRFDTSLCITSGKFVCVCVCNQWVYADNCADAVDWLLILLFVMDFHNPKPHGHPGLADLASPVGSQEVGCHTLE